MTFSRFVLFLSLFLLLSLVGLFYDILAFEFNVDYIFMGVYCHANMHIWMCICSHISICIVLFKLVILITYLFKYVVILVYIFKCIIVVTYLFKMITLYFSVGLFSLSYSRLYFIINLWTFIWRIIVFFIHLETVFIHTFIYCEMLVVIFTRWLTYYFSHGFTRNPINWFILFSHKFSLILIDWLILFHISIHIKPPTNLFYFHTDFISHINSP